MNRKFCLSIFVVVMLFSCSFGVMKTQAKESPVSLSNITSMMKEIRKNTLSEDPAPGRGSEQNMIGLMRSSLGAPDSFQKKYYKDILVTMARQKGVLSSSYYTEYAKLILAVTSMKKDARYVGGYNLFKPLADFKKVKKQGVEVAMWTLIAVDSNSKYSFPKGIGKTRTTEKDLISFILKYQTSDGGFKSVGKTASCDTTALAITALSAHYNSNNSAKKAVDKAINYLSKKQSKNGGFSSDGVENAECVSKVIVALTAMGINPASDSRFVKNGKSAMDSLLSFYVKKKGFAYKKSSGYNESSTEEGYYALAAYQRFLKNKKSLFNMNDLKIVKDKTKYKLRKRKIRTGTRIIFQRGINFLVGHIPGNTDNEKKESEESKKSKDKKEKEEHKKTLIITKEDMIKAARKSKNLMAEGTRATGENYSFSIRGTDIIQAMEFNGRITEDQAYREFLESMADDPKSFRIEQEEFPGKMTLEMEINVSDGTYGLYFYEPVYMKSKLIQKIYVSSGKFGCTVEKGGLYYVAVDSKERPDMNGNEDSVIEGEEEEQKEITLFNIEDGVMEMGRFGENLEDGYEEEYEEVYEDEDFEGEYDDLEEDYDEDIDFEENNTAQHVAAVLVLVGLYGIEFFEKRKGKKRQA